MLLPLLMPPPGDEFATVAAHHSLLRAFVFPPPFCPMLFIDFVSMRAMLFRAAPAYFAATFERLLIDFLAVCIGCFTVYRYAPPPRLPRLSLIATATLRHAVAC